MQSFSKTINRLKTLTSSGWRHLYVAQKELNYKQKERNVNKKNLVSEKQWDNSQTLFTCNLLENVDDN